MNLPMFSINTLLRTFRHLLQKKANLSLRQIRRRWNGDLNLMIWILIIFRFIKGDLVRLVNDCESENAA